MEEILGHGKIIVEVEEHVRDDLAKVERQVDQTMKRIEKDRASIKLDANIAPLEQKVREARDEVKKWRAEVAKDADLGLDTKDAERTLKKWQAKLAQSRRARDEITLDTQQARSQLRRLQRLEEREADTAQKLADARVAGQKRIADANARAAKAASAEWDAALAEDRRRSKAATDAYNAAWDRAIAEDRRRTASHNAVWDAAIREDLRRTQRATDAYNAAWDAALKEDWKRSARTSQIRTAQVERDKAQLASLEAAYAKAFKAADKGQKTTNKTFVPREVRYQAELQTRQAEEQMAALEARLRAAGADPIAIKTKLEFDKKRAGTDVLAGMVSSLSETSVRLGPFTTSIGGAVRSFALLGPVITGVVGALGSLVAVLGSGLTGALGAATGGLGAFGLVLGTSALLFPSLMRDFKNLNTLQDAYHKQVLKTGKNSDKAKEKLEELNHAVKEVGPGARAAYQGFDKLQNSWRNLSKDSRPAFFKGLAEGFKTANFGISRFGEEVTQSFGIVSKGFQGMMRGLRSQEAQSIFQTLFDQGQAALPAFGRGLGNLAEAAGRVAAAFSKMLPSLGSGFETWSDKILGMTQDGDKLEAWARRTTNSMRNLGKFVSALGGFLVTFFGRGVKPGIGLLQDMTQGLNDMTAAIKADPGDVDGFFKDSIKTTKELYGALKPLGQLFMEWATILRPFTDALLQILGVVGDVVSAMADFGPTRALLQGAFAIFLGGLLLSKMVAIGRAAKDLYGVMKGLGALKLGSNILGALTGGGAGVLGGGIAKGAQWTKGKLFGTVAADAAAAATGTKLANSTIKKTTQEAGESAVKSAAKIGAGALATQGAMSAGAAAIGSMGLAATAAATGGIALLVGGLGFLAYKAITAKNPVEQMFKAIDANNKTAVQAGDNYRLLANRSYGVVQSTRAAGASLRDAKKQLDATKKGTREHTDALLNYRQALIANKEAEQQWSQVKNGAEKLAARQIKSAHENVNSLDGQIKKQRELVAEYKKNSVWAGKGPDPAVLAAEQELNRLVGQRSEEFNKQTAAENRLSATAANYARIWRGLTPVLGQAEQQLGKLARSQPKLSKTIALKYESPKDVGKVAAAANKAIGAGGSAKKVLNIVANSKSAEDALKKINAYRLKVKEQKVEQSGANRVIGWLERITGIKFRPKDQKVTESGSNGVWTWLQKITGIRFRPKNQKVSENGSGGVFGWLTRIRDFGLPGKTQQIRESGGTGVLQTLLDIAARAARDVIHRVVTIYSSRGKPPSGGPNGNGSARGGHPSLFMPAYGGATNNMSLSADERMQQRAFERAQKKNTPTTRGGQYRTPTLLIGEENRSEFVIATNPAYRQANTGYLRTVAQQFGYDLVRNSESDGGDRIGRSRAKPFMSEDGITGAFMGAGHALSDKNKKKAKKKSKPKKTDYYVGPERKYKNPGNAVDRTPAAKLGLTNQIMKGGVDLEAIKKPYTKAANEVTQRENAIKNLEKQLARKIANKPTKRKNEKKEPWNNRKKAFNDQVDKIRDELAYARKGESRKGKQAQESLKQLKVMRDDAKARYDQVDGINNQMSVQRSAANQYGSIMNRWAAVYNKSGDVGPDGNEIRYRSDLTGKMLTPSGLYTEAKDARQAALAALETLYRQAAQAAKAGSKFQRDMAESQASTMEEYTVGSMDSLSPPETVGIASLDDYIRQINPSTGLGLDTLLEVQRQQATARLNDSDDPATLTNDRDAAEEERKYYQNVFDRFGSTLSPEIRNELINKIADSQDAVRGFNEQLSGSKSAPSQIDPAQVRDTERYRAMAQYGSNAAGISMSGDRQALGVSRSPFSLADPNTSARVVSNTLASSMASGATAAARMAATPAQGSYAAAALAGGTPTGTSRTNNVEINNTFATVPPEPVQWSQSVGFELGGIL